MGYTVVVIVSQNTDNVCRDSESVLFSISNEAMKAIPQGRVNLSSARKTWCLTQQTDPARRRKIRVFPPSQCPRKCIWGIL